MKIKLKLTSATVLELEEIAKTSGETLEKYIEKAIKQKIENPILKRESVVSEHAAKLLGVTLAGLKNLMTSGKIECEFLNDHRRVVSREIISSYRKTRRLKPYSLDGYHQKRDREYILLETKLKKHEEEKLQLPLEDLEIWIYEAIWDRYFEEKESSPAGIMSKDYLSIPEVQIELGSISRQGVYDLIRRGKLKSEKFGAHGTVVLRASLKAYKKTRGTGRGRPRKDLS